MKRRTAKKQAQRREREWHTMDQRWRDDHRRSYPLPRRKRWRFVPSGPYEYRILGYPQLVCQPPTE